MPNPKQPAKKRQLATPRYKSFRLNKTIKRPKPNLPSGARLFARSLRHLWRQKRPLAGVLLVYFALSVVFVKDDAAVPATAAELEVRRTYQMILGVIVSLAIIWVLRQTAAKNPHVSLRDSFYKAMHPLIPFQLVSIVIVLQLVPIAVAAYLYQQIFYSPIAVTSAEQVLWALLIGGLCLLSLYMVASSIFALYIVTLPDTWPMTALRSARELVRFRRWLVVRKLLFLVVACLVIAGAILLPLLVLAPEVADWTGFLLSLVAVFVVHSYIYQLYRELLA